jgi:hypothetical protein
MAGMRGGSLSRLWRTKIFKFIIITPPLGIIKIPGRYVNAK